MQRIGNGLMMSLVGIVIATGAARWLLTPIDHPDASGARVALVAVQLVVGLALLAWGWRQDRKDRRARGAEYEVFASGVVLLCIGAFFAGTAMHWLITPMSHPEASSLRTAMVWGQALLGVGVMALSRPRLRSAAAA